MEIHAGQLGQQSNLTSQLDSNSDLSKSAKTAHTKMSDPHAILETNPQQRKEKQMARAKAINVKIPTVRVIAGLEQALATLEIDYATQSEKEAKYELSRKVWQKEVSDYAVANISKAENFRTNYRAWNNTLNIDYDLTVSEKEMPSEPEKDFETIHISTYRESKKEITNAIRLLKMTDEETVNTSTYNAIAQYL